MKEKLTGVLDSLKNFWNSTSKKTRIIYLSVAVGILGVSLGVVLMLNRTDYIVLYEGLDPTQNAEVIAQLQELGVGYELKDGKLLISQQDEMNARMQLAYRDYPDSGFSLATFEKGASLTATQYEKEKYTIYQLQERLQATIRTFDEVADAVVTISMPEKNAFVLEQDKTVPKASIKLKLKPGREITSQQIQGIINIVKNSVPGLTEENISIADQAGDLRGTLASERDSASTKLALTEEVNNVIKRRVMSMITPIYGEDKIVVAVNSILDVDQRVTESNTYTPADPSNPTNNPLDYVERARDKTDTTGFAQGVPGATDNTDVPQFAAQEEDLSAAGSYSTHDVYDYLVGSIKSQIVKEGFDLTDVTVAVVIDSSSLPDGERDQIIDVVATTAGVARDKVSVQNIAFNATQTPNLVTAQNQLTNIVIAASGVVAFGIILAIILMALSKKKKQAVAQADSHYGATSLIDLMSHDEEFEPISIPETQEQKLRAQIKDLANSDPEIVAQLIKTWLINA